MNLLAGAAFAEQDSQFARAFSLLAEACAAANPERAFPGAVLAVTHRGALVAHKEFGRFTFQPDSPHVLPETAFDLASLTKVMATTPMAMLLCQRRLIDLDAPLGDLLPELDTSESERWAITLRMLLAHSSGLPAYARLFERARSREEMVLMAAKAPLSYAPGTRAEYSDIGFILLGEVVERAAHESIDHFCQREIFVPLGMTSATFHPQAAALVPPTLLECKFRHRLIQGEVNDENASMMGGVAGHAGLFSNALDVARFAECILRGGASVFSPEIAAQFTRRESTPSGTSRALGWDTPSHPSQSGKYFGPRSFGHLGFTGTSLWCDPDRQLSVALLTNRTWPDGTWQVIKRVRPLVHDAVVEALGLL